MKPKISNDPALFSEDTGLLLASDSTTEDANKALRKGATDFVTCVSGMIDYLDEPLKSKFVEAKTTVSTMLAGLPNTDKGPTGMEESLRVMQQILSVLSHAQLGMTTLAEAAKTAKAEVGTVRASITGEVEKAINTKVTAGELFSKEAIEIKVKEATDSARALFAKEAKTISDRRTSLAAENLPVPADETLGGEETAFKDLKTRAVGRLEKLKGFNLSSAKLSQIAWTADDNSFTSTLELLTEAGAPKKPAGSSGKPNPFISGNPTDKTLRQTIGVC